MILDNLENLKNNFFSVIIVGSGPAGITTALKLEQYGIKTLIIEAGGLDSNYENNKDFLDGNINGFDNDLSVLRARMFGGTSSLWGGYCTKFEKYQFSSWPIDYNEIEKFDKECKEILDLKNYHTDFYIKNFSNNFNQYHVRFAKNIRFKEAFYQKIKDSKNIYLSLNTSFLSFKGSEKKINYIECIKDKKLFKLKSKFYVLAAGGIENSRLLLWSQKNNKDLFHNNLPIGNYYMDHPWYHPAEGFLNYNKFIQYFKKSSVSREFYIDCLPRIYLSPNKDFREKNKTLNIGAYIRIKNNEDHLNRDYLEKAFCMAPNFFKNKFEKNKLNDFFRFTVSLHQEQDPNFKNKISLGKKKDPNGVPLVDLNWSMSTKMKKTAKEMLMGLGDFFIKENIGRISIDEHIFDSEKFEETFTGTHQMGGTCAGDSYHNSVVDKNLKVHLIKNLFVSGSSVFTTSGHGHPTYTIVLLSLKLGEHLKKIL